MEIHNDEARRQLRDSDELNREAMPEFLEALKRAFDPTTEADDATKAQLLGVPMPHRRSFLKMGGLTLAGAAVLAACGGDDDDDGASGAGGATSTTGMKSSNMDLVLAKTAASLEALAIETYETAAASGLVTTPAVGEAAKLFLDHHQQHMDAINKGTGVNYTTPNAAVRAALVDPAVKAAKTESDIGNLAYMLEDAAAQTYVFAASALSTPALRSTIMTIGGTEAKHKAILSQLLKKPAADVFGGTSFYNSDNPLAGIQGALIS